MAIDCTFPRIYYPSFLVTIVDTVQSKMVCSKRMSVGFCMASKDSAGLSFYDYFESVWNQANNVVKFE